MTQWVTQAFKQLIEWKSLSSKARYHLSVDLRWHHHNSRFFLSHFRTCSPTNLKPILFYKHNPLYIHARICTRPCLPKILQILDAPIHLGYHFFVRTNYRGTLQLKLRIQTNVQDQYLSTTFNVNLSTTKSPNIQILF